MSQCEGDAIVSQSPRVEVQARVAGIQLEAGEAIHPEVLAGPLAEQPAASEYSLLFGMNM